MMILPDTFLFEFFDEEAEITTSMSFNVKCTDAAPNIVKIAIQNGEHAAFNDVLDELESEYGVHDVGFCPDTEFIGFNTYETEPDRYEELMVRWKEFFLKTGFEVSETTVK